MPKCVHQVVESAAEVRVIGAGGEHGSCGVGEGSEV